MKRLLALLVSWLVLTPTVASAQDNVPTSGIEELNPLLSVFNSLVRYFLDWIPKLGGAVVVVMIIYSGILYITGNPERGKKTLLAAIIGAIIIAMAYVIVSSLNTILIAPKS